MLRPSYLVIEDEPASAAYLCAMLRRIHGADMTVTTVPHAEAALPILRRRPFSAVLSDHAMPRMPGVDLLEIARREAPGTQRILVTGQLSLDVARDAINRAGIHAFLRKPYELDHLRAALDTARLAASLRP